MERDDGLYRVHGLNVEVLAQMMDVRDGATRQELVRQLERMGVASPPLNAPASSPATSSASATSNSSGALSSPVGRIGVLGGTFDPIHIAHLALASEAHWQLGLDGVIFVPAGQPWRK